MRRFAGIAFLRLGLISSLLITFRAFTQDIPVGTWRTHFSYANARILENTSDKIFCAAENGIFSVDLTNGSIRKLSKLDGLSDAGVSAMYFDDVSNVLIIGYRSGLVDFISENEIETLSEIESSDLEGDKQINDISVLGTNTFLATALGIVVVETGTATIRENFVQIGPSGEEVAVNKIAIADNKIFASTSIGIQSGDLSNNLLDFNNWTHYPSTENLIDITLVANDLFTRNGSSLFQFISDNWTDTGVNLPDSTSELYSSENKLLTAAGQEIFQLTGNQFLSIAQVLGETINDIVEHNEVFWVADSFEGLITSEGNSLSPRGPISDHYSQLRVIDNDTYGFHAPSPEGYDGTSKANGYSFFSEAAWSSIEIPNFQNISDATSYQGSMYFSSIGDGLFNQTANETTIDIPQSSSSLDTVITSLTSQRNLWVASFGNSNPIHQWNGEQWNSFSSAQLLDSKFLELETSESEIVWGRTQSRRLITFDASENRVQSLTGIPGLLENFDISIEDDVWVASSSGPTTYPDGSFIFESNESIAPVFDGRVLFEDEPINDIATDGGNRVWFATNRGLWIFDENISTQVALFDVDNSPIPSNEVLKLAYNSVNGEMFISTSKGLVSYRSASSIGSITHQNVNVFPNPVPPEYQGLIGIEGLAKNVTIKITDINGSLVKEINASGSSASWDLRNNRNAEVVTGVYLLFSSTEDGVETYVGKIAVIR